MLPLSEYSYIFLIHLRLDDMCRKADNAIVLIWKGPKTFPQDTKPDGVGDVWFFLFKSDRRCSSMKIPLTWVNT